MTYSFQRDLNLDRWITNVTVSGIGTWQFGADGKGGTAEVLNPFSQLTTRRFDPDSKPVRENRSNGTYSLYSYTSRDWFRPSSTGRRTAACWTCSSTSTRAGRAP